MTGILDLQGKVESEIN